MSARAYGTNLVQYTTWAALTAYEDGVYVVPTSPGVERYECTTAGKTGAEEPTWDDVVGHTTVDGNTGPPSTAVTWTTRALLLASSPYELVLDTEGYGGYALKEVWVKAAADSQDTDFYIYGSDDGDNWRDIEDISIVEAGGEGHKQVWSAYRHIKVAVTTTVEIEMEIVAGVS